MDKSDIPCVSVKTTTTKEREGMLDEKLITDIKNIQMILIVGIVINPIILVYIRNR